MKRKIRFPLKMENNIEVRSIEELRKHFSLERVLFYLSNGKLVTWLKDRYMDELADKIKNLDERDPELSKKLCEVLDVKHYEQFDVNIDIIAERNRKKSILNAYTSEQKYFDLVDNIAFDQDDLYDLIDNEETTIYLCGKRFFIPLSKQNITYIGVNNPTVVIESKEVVNWENKNISLENVQYDEKYQQILEAVLSANSEKTNQQIVSFGAYSESYLTFMMSPDEKRKSEQCYQIISREMSHLNYDIDNDIKKLHEKLKKSNIVGIASNFVNSL